MTAAGKTLGVSIRVVAVDVGSIKPPSRFAWAALDTPERRLIADGEDPETAVQAVLGGLRAGGRAAVLFEAPMSVPVPPAQHDQWSLLGRARYGDRDRPWSAAAGAGVLATGLAQGAWMLGRLAAAEPDLTVTTQPAEWMNGDAPLLLAEAFVSGAGKPVPLPAGQHAADAAAAALALAERLDDDEGLVSDVRCAPQHAFNLWAAMAMWARLRIDPEELRQEILVVRLHPQPH